MLPENHKPIASIPKQPDASTNQQVIKDSHKATNEARQTAKHYQGLAGSYQLLYNKDTEAWKAITTIEGITYELLQELTEFANKNGFTDRVKKSLSRLMLFESNIGTLSKIQLDNFNLSNTLRNERIENHRLKQEVADLTRRLQLHTENL